MSFKKEIKEWLNNMKIPFTNSLNNQNLLRMRIKITFQMRERKIKTVKKQYFFNWRDYN